MESHIEIYRRLFPRRSSLDLGPRWGFVQRSRRFGFLEIDPERTLPSLLDEFDEGKLVRSGVAIRVDDELVLNPMLMTDDRLAALVGDYDLVTSGGALVHTAPLFAMDTDLTTYCRVHPQGLFFLVGSMHEYLLFDSLKMAASPTTHLGRLGRRRLETMLYLVDGVSEGLIARRGNYPPGDRYDYGGYLGPEETRPAEMSLVFVGYELGSGRRGFTGEATSAMQRLFNAQHHLRVNWDQLYVWWPTDEEIADLEFRRRLSDVELIHEFFRNLESLRSIKGFFEFLRRDRHKDPLVQRLEDLLIAEDEARDHPEMSLYRKKKETALGKYAEQVDRATFTPLVQSAMNSNDLRIRSLRLQLAHVSRLVHMGMPSLHSAQAHRLRSIDADEAELFPAAKWKQMDRLLDATVKLVREETRIRSRARRS